MECQVRGVNVACCREVLGFLRIDTGGVAFTDFKVLVLLLAEPVPITAFAFCDAEGRTGKKDLSLEGDITESLTTGIDPGFLKIGARAATLEEDEVPAPPRAEPILTASLTSDDTGGRTGGRGLSLEDDVAGSLKEGTSMF